MAAHKNIFIILSIVILLSRNCLCDAVKCADGYFPAAPNVCLPMDARCSQSHLYLNNNCYALTQSSCSSGEISINNRCCAISCITNCVTQQLCACCNFVQQNCVNLCGQQSMCCGGDVRLKSCTGYLNNNGTSGQSSPCPTTDQFPPVSPYPPVGPGSPSPMTPYQPGGPGGPFPIPPYQPGGPGSSYPTTPYQPGGPVSPFPIPPYQPGGPGSPFPIPPYQPGGPGSSYPTTPYQSGGPGSPFPIPPYQPGGPGSLFPIPPYQPGGPGSPYPMTPHQPGGPGSPFPTTPYPPLIPPITQYPPTPNQTSTPGSPTNTQRPSTTPTKPVPACPPGSVQMNGKCRMLYCPFGTILKNDRCVITQCPDGTVWRNGRCSLPQPIEHNIVLNHTIINHLNASKSDIVVNTYNNLTVNAPINLGGDLSPAPSSPPLPPQPSPLLPNASERTATNTSSECCTVLSPRVCKSKGKGRWICTSRRQQVCGEFCTAPTIILTPPRIQYQFTGSIHAVVMPPQVCGVGVLCPPVDDYYDCSGCGIGRMEFCSSYCYRYHCPAPNCRFYDQHTYCSHHIESFGCQVEDGCFDNWCFS